MLLSCNSYAYLTIATSHGKKWKNIYVLIRKNNFKIMNSVLWTTTLLENKMMNQNEICCLSSTTWNQQVREESTDNSIKHDASNSYVKNHAISVISDYRQEDGEVTQEDREVMLQPEIYFYLSY